MSFNVHEVRWTPELVGRFWDSMSQLPVASENYFSQQVGDALVHFVLRHGALGAKVLDYGAGKGHLTAQLLKQSRARVYSCEFSETAAREISLLFSQERRFGGCALVKESHLEYPDNEFDTVFLVETLEHLLPGLREVTLREIYRVLRTEGTLIVTTPNNERLADNFALCPECGAIFHRMQHVAAFDRQTLQRLMEEAGFRTVFCDAVQLHHYKPDLGWKGVYRRWRYRKFPRPHLIFVGRKK